MAIRVKREVCCYCGGCSAVCPRNALDLIDTYLYIRKDLCIMCKNCIKVCPLKAIEVVE